MKIGEPQIVERVAQPYVGVRRQVRIPFGPQVDEAMGALFGALESQGIQPSGPVFFKYNVIMMPDLEIEFAIEVGQVASPVGELLAGVLPAGRYAQLTYVGSYDSLIEANRVLIEWVRERELEFDMHAEADGDHFAARIELYLNGPDEVPEDELETVVAIRLRD